MNTHNLEKSLNHALFHKSYSLKKHQTRIKQKIYTSPKTVDPLQKPVLAYQPSMNTETRCPTERKGRDQHHETEIHRNHASPRFKRIRIRRKPSTR